jgi:flagellar biosynthesis/type III secretory pathway protein FliH
MIGVLLLGTAFAVGAFAASPKHHKDHGAAHSKVNRHDPAFRTGYMDGYRQGSNDSEALSNSYRDESGPLYSEALDGYTRQYGDQASYQQLFRLGYIEGYKAGWDFNSGQYNPLGAGGGGGAGGG